MQLQRMPCWANPLHSSPRLGSPLPQVQAHLLEALTWAPILPQPLAQIFLSHDGGGACLS